MLQPKLRRPEQASGEVGTTFEMFRSMQMTFWPPRAEAELAEIAWGDGWSPWRQASAADRRSVVPT